MPGELSLSKLLRTLRPQLDPRTFVFITIPHSQQPLAGTISFADVQMSFREDEGLTIITTLEFAEKQDLDYIYRSRMVTLDVHSSLEAVGFMKAISSRLADEGLSSNPVSAYYHDHLFVEEDEAGKVVEILNTLAEEAKAIGGGTNAKCTTLSRNVLELSDEPRSL